MSARREGIEICILPHSLSVCKEPHTPPKLYARVAVKAHDE